MFNDPDVKKSSEKAAYYIFSHICNDLDEEKKIVLTLDTDLEEVMDEIGARELTKRVFAVKYEDIEVYYPIPITWKMTKRSFTMGKNLILDTIATIDTMRECERTRHLHEFNPALQVGVKVRYKLDNEIYVISDNSKTDPCLSDDEVHIEYNENGRGYHFEGYVPIHLIEII